MLHRTVNVRRQAEDRRHVGEGEAADEVAPELTELVGPPVEQPTLPLADAA